MPPALLGGRTTMHDSRVVSLRVISEKLVDHARRNPGTRVNDAIEVISANISKIFVRNN
jgi:hypothetical protein